MATILHSTFLEAMSPDPQASVLSNTALPYHIPTGKKEV